MHHLNRNHCLSHWPYLPTGCSARYGERKGDIEELRRRYIRWGPGDLEGDCLVNVLPVGEHGGGTPGGIQGAFDGEALCCLVAPEPDDECTRASVSLPLSLSPALCGESASRCGLLILRLRRGPRGDVESDLCVGLRWLSCISGEGARVACTVNRGGARTGRVGSERSQDARWDMLCVISIGGNHIGWWEGEGALVEGPLSSEDM